jgi:hypothetical protein
MEFHYTWQFGRHFAPLLRFLREIGFFEAPVYMTAMSVPAAPLFVCVFRSVRRRGPTAGGRAARFLRYGLYLFMCWLAMTSLAVAFKTMIVEELDYQQRQWFEPYLPGIHFYVTSACLAHVALVAQSKLRVYHLLLVLYTQVALLAGYAVAGYRALSEDFAGAAGGVVLFAFFAACNYDLIARARRGFSARGEI